MHVISRKKLLECSKENASLSSSLDIWYRIAKAADWHSLAEVRQVLPSADAVGKYPVFNIKGNHYRLICEINYGTGRLSIRDVLMHSEYNKGGWKQ